jgi:UDP-N-acetylmuramyl pentapeptide phosphotransferase/UDP-N-acetylglucosamine-1-phosphate transferase
MSLGAVLAILAIWFAYELLAALLGSPVVQSGLVLVGMLLFILAWIWGKLPEWFRKFVRKQVHKRRNRHEEE